MKTLALEFSSDHRSVAVLLPGTGPAGQRTGEALQTFGRPTNAFAMIERALTEAKVSRAEIELVAVGLGPGSSTGIRTAIAIAQGWHLGRGVKVAGLSSLMGLAAQLHAAGERGHRHLIVDAQRREYHLASYDLSGQEPRALAPLRLVSAGEIEALIQAGEIVMGPSAAAAFVGARDAFPDAAALARLAVGGAAFTAPETLEPIHLRRLDFVKAPQPRPPATAGTPPVG